MTQEDKELLLKDLVARLPYEVKVNHFGTVKELLGIMPSSENVMVGYDINDYEDSVIEDIKPYLRPMSSMTEEEMKEYHSYCECDGGDFTGESLYFDTIESFDYLNSIHVDYRNLIPLGLAIEVTEENNPYKE